jgi:hypothetical protein
VNISEYFFDKFIRTNLYEAVDATLKESTKYSCALLLAAYTEMLGGVVSGNLLKKYHGRQNFSSFLEYMGNVYSEINDRIDVSDYMRNGLIHEFEPKKRYTIEISDDDSGNKVGIEYHENLKILRINLREYYRDFKKGVDKFHDEVQGPNMKIEKMDNLVQCVRPDKVFPPQGGELDWGQLLKDYEKRRPDGGVL